MAAKSEVNLMEIIDLMGDEPDGYMFISAKRQEDGSIKYHYVVSDILHADHLLNRAGDMMVVRYEENPDDIE